METRWEGKWDQLKGQVRQEWGRLTDDDLQQAQGDREELVGRIKEKYGETREEISQKLDQLASRLN